MLACVVLLVRIAAAVLCHMPLARVPVAVVDPVLGAIEICTNHGLQALVSSGETDTRKPLPAPEPCPACALTAVLLLAVVAAFVRLGLSLPAMLRWATLHLSPLAVHLASGANRSRAPPVPA